MTIGACEAKAPKDKFAESRMSEVEDITDAVGDAHMAVADATTGLRHRGTGDDASKSDVVSRDGSRAVAPKTAKNVPPEDDEEIPAWVGMACCGVLVLIIGVLMALGYRLMPEKDAFDHTKVVKFEHDAVLRTVVWPKSGGGSPRGSNSQDTDWAIFFYKPYCPACRRVWPIFRALGNTVNSTKLRFGEVDCVKDRGVCNMMGAEKHPLIRIYKSVPTKGGGWKREGAAEWQGLLIAYEIMQWFVDQQGAGVVSSDVNWP